MLNKLSALDLLTGRMGAGKSTLAHLLRPKYDLVVGTDFSRPMIPGTGQYKELTREEKQNIRAEKLQRILAAHAEGKRVLVEGHPPGLVKLFRDELKRADQLMLIPVSKEESFQRVEQRAKADPAERSVDIDMDSARYNNDLYDHYLDRLTAVLPPQDLMADDGETKMAMAVRLPSERHQKALDDHFTSPDPKRWRTFRRNLRSKSFAEAVKNDDRADSKLKQFADMVGRHLRHRGESVPVFGTKKYKVKFHEDISRYSCSCPDWTYKKSVLKERDADCKHIRQVKTDKANLLKEAGGILGALINPSGIGAAANLLVQKNKAEEEAWKARLVNQAHKKEFGRLPGLIRMMVGVG